MEYSSLLNLKTGAKWKTIGVEKRTGVAFPLFSIYSKSSIGIGEIPDIRLMIDWCVKTGKSIIQLLPLNEVGYDFSPYNSISTFALEPMYLSLKKLRKVNLKPFLKEIRELKKSFPKNNIYVDYEIKNAKQKLLKKIFESPETQRPEKFEIFISENKHWLKYYSLFKVLTRLNEYKGWELWELKHKYISSFTAEKILQNYSDEILFYEWLQWQLYEQFVSIKKYAGRKKVYIMGDLPFLVSRNSAEVWAYKNYFKMKLSSGAPPDMFFSSGQRWGMPPYNWEHIEADKFGYIKQRLKYAENFYDMFRIDHFVGLFRVWTIDTGIPEVLGGLNGKFDPEEEFHWEDHGRKILTVMNDCTKMLPCAEDLGTVPSCSEKLLKEFGIPGINIQRWEKKWDDSFNFIPANDYRINSVAALSTHDSSTLPAWWKFEAGSVDEISFEKTCMSVNIAGERFVQLKQNLFENKDSHYGKLYWKKEISNVFVLLNFLKLDYEKCRQIVEMYLSTYNEKNKFWSYIGLKGETEDNVSVKFIKKCHEKIKSASSIFNIQLIIEYMYLKKNFLEKYSGWDYRINLPGTLNDRNWRLRLPVSLEELIAEYG